jgi:hypothetical protein
MVTTRSGLDGKSEPAPSFLTCPAMAEQHVIFVRETIHTMSVRRESRDTAKVLSLGKVSTIIQQ